jgi:hypothetical protein
MVKPSSLSMTAVGMVVLIGAAGCTRTSDGSIVPVMFSRFADPAPVPQYQAQVNEPRTYPPARARPAAKAAPRVAKVTGPSMSIVKNPPFKRVDPSQPLSCRNETSPSGRIRVVCS